MRIVLQLVTIFMVFLNLSFKNSKKILMINSYHKGYVWSDKLEEGVKSVLGSNADIALEIKYMDSKRNKSGDFISSKAAELKNYIEQSKPDLLIASDDNASKYLIKPYYKNHKIPVVFCGVNWTAKNYEYPYKNVTGMVEVSPIKLAFKYFNEFSGKKIEDAKFGHLEEDTISGRKNAENIERYLGIKLQKEYAKNYEEWKEKFRKLNDTADFITMGGNAEVENWDKDAAVKFVEEHTKAITATDLDWMILYSLFGFVKVPEEQGEWAAKTAIEILNGKAPSKIPIAFNQQGNLMLNMKIAKKLKIKIPYQLVTKAKVIIK